MTIQSFLQPTKEKLSLIAAFIRRHLLAIVALIIGGATAAAVLRRSTNKVSTIGDAISVQRAKVEVIKQTKIQADIERVDAGKANEILNVNQRIVEQHKVIAEAMTGEPWEKLSDAQIRAALREAGLGK
jgi:hypothetical protein